MRTKNYPLPMEFEFNKDKNDKLFKERGVTFYNVIDSIFENGILLNFNHPNSLKYPHQKILVVKINDYTYCVPYETVGEKYFLKTIFPSRKFLYLIEGEKDE